MCKSKMMATFALAVGVSSYALGQNSDVEFSAEMVQQTPQGETTSKMYAGNGRVRMDMEQGGQPIIHIMDTQRQVNWLIYPAQKSYLEQRGAPGGAMPGKAPIKPANPCAGMPGATCKKLGTEKVSGREAEKWEISLSHEGKTMTSTQWIDVKRGVPLRQDFGNGQTTEMRFLGMDSVDGRAVEKWEMLSSRPGQEPQRSLQWYDPRLELAIRQEFPGGYLSEIRNIKEGKQPDELFSLPAGYKQISMPEMGEPEQQNR